MAALFSPVTNPPEEVGLVAIAIGMDARHLALLFRFEVNEPMMVLHLAWEHDLRCEDVWPQMANNYLGVTIDRGPMRSEAVADQCLNIVEANPGGLPYAFGDPSEAFDENHKFIPGNQRVGLTCASFVLAVLEQAGIRLVIREDWGENYDDPQFYRWIIRALSGEIPGYPAANPDHVAAVRAQIAAGAIRYRPIEVAGAATSDSPPASFARAIGLGRDLLPRLTSDDTPPHLIP
jgi:hypothetical protein